MERLTQNSAHANCQVGSQTSGSTLPQALIRAEAHPGTLSVALEYVHFLTLIPCKPFKPT